jgi:hypothetical protein
MEEARLGSQALARRTGFAGLQAPAHLNWFTATSMRSALHAAGYEDVRIALGPPELARPSHLRRRLANCLKRAVCLAA